MDFNTVLDIAGILGLATFIFGPGVVLMVLGLMFGALISVVYGIVRLVRWVCE